MLPLPPIGPPSHDDVTRCVVDWCDSAITGQVRITCALHGLVGTIDVSRMPEELATDRIENSRRYLLARLAHHATLIESRIDGAAAWARIDGPNGRSLADIEDRWTWPDYRSRSDSNYRPWPIPENALAWWRAHRGWVRIDCKMHGEVATFDVSRDPRMLGLLWDAGLIECDWRYQSNWQYCVDDPEFEGMDCYPRIIPFGGTLEDDLLKVIEMWIRLEGPPAWWPYEMVPGFEVREPQPEVSS